MSVQAMAWVFRQDIRNRAKMVLMAIANHADHTNGYCYPSIDLIMDEASVSRASAYSFIAALRRNDYVTVKVVKDKNGRRVYHFWMNFDRMDAPWMAAKSDETDLSEEPETQDVDAIPNPGHEENTPGIQNLDEPVQDLDARVQNLDSAYRMLEPSNKPSIPEQLDSAPAPAAPPPRVEPQPLAPEARSKAFGRTQPHGFDPNARQRELERLKAAEEARKPKAHPVIEGSAPWNAWVKHGHKPGLVGTIEINGRLDRGWYFPTLWPPKETGPPATGDPPPEAKKAG